MSTVILLALVGCDTPAETSTPTAAVAAPGVISDHGETVLTVNGTPVGRRELDLVFERMRIPPDQISEYAWTRGGKHVAEEYALATVLYDRAVAEKLHEDPDVALQLAFAERQVLANAMRQKLAEASITEEAITRYYEDNKVRFDKPEVRARHIQVADETLAKDLSERLKAGEDFATLAKAHSTDMLTKTKGGEVGWFHQHENPLWGDAAFAADKGAVLGPLQSRLGWHLVEVLDKRDSTPIEDVRPEAREQLEHQQATIVIEELRTAMKVEWVREPEGGANPHGAPVHPKAAEDPAAAATPAPAPAN